MKFKVVRTDNLEMLERLLNEGWQFDGDSTRLLDSELVILFKEVN